MMRTIGSLTEPGEFYIFIGYQKVRGANAQELFNNSGFRNLRINYSRYCHLSVRCQCGEQYNVKLYFSILVQDDCYCSPFVCIHRILFIRQAELNVPFLRDLGTFADSLLCHQISIKIAEN